MKFSGILTSLLVGSLLLSSADVSAVGYGTGFFVSKQGHIATAAHVVKNSNSVIVYTSDGKSHPAEIQKIDQANDLALLKIDIQVHRPLVIKNSVSANKGDEVYTLGFPNPYLQGFEEPKLTYGVISSFSGLKSNPTRMQIQVPIQPGNSGGPLIDSSGAVIGVVVSTLNAQVMLETQKYVPQSVNFAVKSEYLLPLLRGVDTPRYTRNERFEVRKQIESLERSVVLLEVLEMPSEPLVSKAEPPVQIACGSLKNEIYTVQSGDTLSNILVKFKIDYQNLMEWNNLDPSKGYRPQVGDRLKVSTNQNCLTQKCAGDSFHVIQRGDTLAAIGLKYGRDWRDLLKWNHIQGPNQASVGDRLRVKDPSCGE